MGFYGPFLCECSMQGEIIPPRERQHERFEKIYIFILIKMFEKLAVRYVHRET